jgi:ferredoxin-type protein NapH
MNSLRVPSKQDLNKYRLSGYVFFLSFALLAVVQVKMSNRPIILLERFVRNGGWFEIAVISAYGAYVIYKMQNPMNVPKWRRITWSVFCIVFFSQLIIGLLGAERFLMTGKLHLPIPMMILGGPLYRGQLSVMTILFLSTIVITGPAWCSQLCYFGAFDNMASWRKNDKISYKHKKAIKTTLLFLIIVFALVMRWLNVPVGITTILAVAFGIIGIAIMMWYSRKKGKMVHCTLYCPIGTLVNVIKPVNPFRLYINDDCTQCMKCTTFCKYDALNIADVKNKKPNYSCTLCGDCLAACRDKAIKYRYLNLKPETARNLYLVLTITLHCVFLALGRL